MGSYLFRLLVAVMVAGLPASAAADEKLEVEAAGDAIVAHRDVNTAGIVFGLTADEVKGLIDTRMDLRRAHEKQIEDIAENLGLDRCTVAEELRKLALEEVPDGASPGPVAELEGSAAKGKPVAEMAASSSAKGPVAPAELTKDAEQARTRLITIGRGIVAGRDVNIEGDVVFGIQKTAFMVVIDELRRQDVAYAEKLRILSADLNVNRCATESFLRTLGENQVPVGQLRDRLMQIAQNHLRLVEQWASVTEVDPEVTDLRERARKAIDNTDYARADELLEQAGEKMRAKADQTSALGADYARVEADRGRLALVRLQYESAAEAFEKAHSYAELAGVQQEGVRYLELQAAALQDVGDYVGAETAFMKAFRVLKEADSKDMLHRAMLLNNLGTLFYARSEYKKAAKRFQRALRTIEEATHLSAEAEAMQRSISLNGLGEAAMARSLFEEAGDYYARALKTAEDTLGAHDRRLMNLLSNLARLKGDLGMVEAAERLFRRALGLNHGVLSATDPEVAAVKNNLADLHFAHGKVEAAEKLWLEAWDVYQAALGKDHILTLGVQQNLANAYRKQGRLQEAEQKFKEVLSGLMCNADDKGWMDEEHLVLASVHDGLADLYAKQGALDQAEEHYELAKEIVDRRFGRELEGHPLWLSLMNDSAVLLERNGKYERAAQDYVEARRLFKLKFGDRHVTYGTVTSNLARVYGRLGRLEEAEALYREAIGIAEESGDRSKVAYRNQALGKLHRKQGRLDDARRRLETARDIYVEERGEEDSKTLAVNKLLAELALKPARPVP